jgi:hypothetical protein
MIAWSGETVQCGRSESIAKLSWWASASPTVAHSKNFVIITETIAPSWNVREVNICTLYKYGQCCLVGAEQNASFRNVVSAALTSGKGLNAIARLIDRRFAGSWNGPAHWRSRQGRIVARPVARGSGRAQHSQLGSVVLERPIEDDY